MRPGHGPGPSLRVSGILYYILHIINTCPPSTSFIADGAASSFRRPVSARKLDSDMGRRAAGGARVVPAATITACSSSSAEVLTPVVPVDHVAQSGAEQGKGEVPLLYLVESGAASSKCYRDDGEEEVSQLPSPMRSDVKTRMLPFGLGMTVEVIVDGAPLRVGHTTPQPNESVLASREGGTSAESEDSHLPHLPHLPLQQNSAASAGSPFLATALSLACASRFRRRRFQEWPTV
jgi:hypothetical protein